jgi:hypothetical protein
LKAFKTVDKKNEYVDVPEISLKIIPNIALARTFFNMEFEYKPTMSHEPLYNVYFAVEGDNLQSVSGKNGRRKIGSSAEEAVSVPS